MSGPYGTVRRPHFAATAGIELEELSAAHLERTTPADFIDWFARKYDLDRIDCWPQASPTPTPLRTPPCAEALRGWQLPPHRSDSVPSRVDAEVRASAQP